MGWGGVMFFQARLSREEVEILNRPKDSVGDVFSCQDDRTYETLVRGFMLCEEASIALLWKEVHRIPHHKKTC